MKRWTFLHEAQYFARFFSQERALKSDIVDPAYLLSMMLYGIFFSQQVKIIEINSQCVTKNSSCKIITKYLIFWSRFWQKSSYEWNGSPLVDDTADMSFLFDFLLLMRLTCTWHVIFWMPAGGLNPGSKVPLVLRKQLVWSKLVLPEESLL